jgi:2-polyprenyl-3-methyl-5-hydroxy-6-metoxy-1,4-benzoquinol methylase
MSHQPPSPEKILSHTLQGMASTTALGAAATHSLFTHIEGGAGTAEEIARAAGISVRGAQALLDAMVALELVKVDGKYKNSPEASFYLVEGKPAYLGAHAKMVFSPFGRSFLNLPEVVKTGASDFEYGADVADNPFWEELVLAIVPLALPVTHALVERLKNFATMASPSVLDIGGGSGIFSVALLQANKTATSTQIDWAAVNRIAERFVARHGFADHFKTIDGDFHTANLGEGAYDVVIYSNIAHQESPAENIAMFHKAKKALKPDGVLVISDFVLNDDRTSNHPWTGIFHTFMLLQSKAGATWRQADYRAWLNEAGFQKIEFSPTMSPSTLVIAR